MSVEGKNTFRYPIHSDKKTSIVGSFITNSPEGVDIKGWSLLGQRSFQEYCSTMNVLAIGWLAFLSSIRDQNNHNQTANVVVRPRTTEEREKAREALLGNGTDELMEDNMDANTKMARIQSGKSLWTTVGKGVVPYVIHHSLNGHRNLIEGAMNQFHRYTCIRFVPRTWQEDYVELVLASGCSSYVGRIGGRQELKLGDGCHFTGTVIHELGHAIGLDHEHQRADRDNYIHVFWQNIEPGKNHNFELRRSSSLGLPYNYNSVMHYDKTAFSKDPERLFTMWAKNRRKLGQPYDKEGLNSRDIQHINKLYRC